MRIARLALVMILVLALFSISSAQEMTRTATVIRLEGTVEVKTAAGAWMPAAAGMVLNQGDAIRTKLGASAVIVLDGKEETAIVEVRPESQLGLLEMFGDPKKEGDTRTLLDLAIGDILIKAKKLHSENSKFEVKTPISFVGVRGTIFSVSVRPAR